MKSLYRIALCATVALIAMGASAAPESPLTYSVNYQWGFINKTAAHGTVTLGVAGDRLFATLNGHSIPWGGRIYTVSDTLSTVVSGSGKNFSQRVLYRNGWYSKPETGQDPALVKSNPAMYRTILGQGELSASPDTMEAVTITTDMLGFFYLASVIDFNDMQVGEVLTVPIEEPGGVTDHLQVTYHGISDYAGQQCYNVTFNYSYDGVMSAYPVECLISTENRIPLSISASLLIGHMAMIYE